MGHGAQAAFSRLLLVAAMMDAAAATFRIMGRGCGGRGWD